MTIDELIEKIKSLPRYDCAGPEGDYDAGMVPGDGYVDAYELDKLLSSYASRKQGNVGRGEN